MSNWSTGAIGGAGLGLALAPLTGGASIPAALAFGATGAAGGGIMDLFGVGGNSKKNSDPLAGIRAQLQAIATRQQALADQVPGMVEKQKGLVRDIYGGYKTEGTQAIGENIHADRGFGNTSLEDRLRNELFGKLAKSQAQEELAAEQWGLKAQSDIYGTSAGTYNDIAGLTPPEAQSPWPAVLRQGAQTVGQLFGQKDWTQSQTTGTDYGNLLLPKSFSEDIAFRPGTKSFKVGW